MTGRVALPILVGALILAPALAAAQALGPDEAHGAQAHMKPAPTLTAPQKANIYAVILRQRLRMSATEVPLIVGASVPRSTPLLALPDEAAGDEYTAEVLKYATVDGNVVLIDTTTMRVIDIIRDVRAAGP
jgi:hypothetical protein